MNLHPNMPVSVRTNMYFLWDTLVHFLDRATFIPRKYQICLKSLTSNSVVNFLFFNNLVNSFGLDRWLYGPRLLQLSLLQFTLFHKEAYSFYQKKIRRNLFLKVWRKPTAIFLFSFERKMRYCSCFLSSFSFQLPRNNICATQFIWLKRAHIIRLL